MYLSIVNLFPPNGGEVDYKGLDISKFVPQSQSYNFIDGSVVLETTEQLDVSTFEDVQVLTQDEYAELVSLHKELQPTPEDKMESIQNENANLLFQNAMQDTAIQSLQDENAGLMFLVANIQKGGN